MGIQGSGAGNDDEPGDDVGKNATRDHVQSRSLVLAASNSFLHDGRLQIKLHPWGDGGAHHGNHHVQVTRLPKHFAGRWLNGGNESVDPGWFRQDTGENVSHVKERRDQENFFHGLVLAFEDDDPHDECANRNRDVLGKAEQFKAAGDSGKLSHYIAEVDDQDTDHHEEGNAEAKLFPDEVAETLAGYGTHASRDLLDHDQRQGGGNHRP